MRKVHFHEALRAITHYRCMTYTQASLRMRKAEGQSPFCIPRIDQDARMHTTKIHTLVLRLQLQVQFHAIVWPSTCLLRHILVRSVMGLGLTPNTTFKKRQRRTGSPAGEESRTSTSSRTQGTRATSSNIGSGHYDDVVGESSRHGTGRSRDCRSSSEEAGVSVRAHDELARKLRHLREDLADTQHELERSRREVDDLREQVDRLCSFGAVDRRLRALEQVLPRLKGQLDVLMRMQMPAERPPYSAQAPPYHTGPGPGMN